MPGVVINATTESLCGRDLIRPRCRRDGGSPQQSIVLDFVWYGQSMGNEASPIDTVVRGAQLSWTSNRRRTSLTCSRRRAPRWALRVEVDQDATDC